jgi:hypothetical protein
LIWLLDCTAIDGRRGLRHLTEQSPLLALSLLALVSLHACSAARGLNSEPAAGVDLSGEWRAVAAASDDPEKFLIARHGHSQGRIARSAEVSGGNAEGVPPIELEAAAPDRGPRELLAKTAQLSDALSIHQSATRFDVNYGNHLESYPTDEREAVIASMPDGIAERFTGWKSQEFVVFLNSKTGARVEEQYALGDNKDRLIVTTNVTEGGQRMKLRRVFERTANAFAGRESLAE